MVDLLLGEGEPTAQDRLRQRLAEDPALALELAETVALFEACRQLRVEPGARFAGRMHDVVRRAERRLPAPRSSPWWVAAGWLAAAAAVVSALLWHFDPLGRRAVRALPGPIVHRAPARPMPPPVAGEGVAAPVLPEVAPAVAWAEAIEAMRWRLGIENSHRLEQAMAAALEEPADPLQRWLAPHNALASLRASHERRTLPEVRRAALRHQGGLEDADARVQELAARLAADLRSLPLGARPGDVGAVALAVRAVLAAGADESDRAAALADGGDWLANQLPELAGARLASALAALVEVAAVTGRHGERVRAHGRRLVDEVLQPDPETWRRRRPELLGAAVPVATLADAARVAQLLPGLGVDPARCLLVRQLLLGRLRERRDAGDDGPELLAALLYGGADLLDAGERAEVERQLRRWTPLRLAPDFVTVHQLAWGFEPGRLGFTRLQRELRRLSVLPDPGAMASRAAFCLCLATQYAAWPGGGLGTLADGG
ncbi:MAG: hypothetical protein KF830_10030 [Planctomycetes bacterium]|nr:hypothetical protein [Planctomycetota bacterium]